MTIKINKKKEEAFVQTLITIQLVFIKKNCSLKNRKIKRLLQQLRIKNKILSLT